MASKRNNPRWALWVCCITLTVLVLMSAYFVYLYNGKVNQLKDNGITTNAYIYDIRVDYAPKRITSPIRYYRFAWDGKMYEGESGHYIPNEIGDSVCIVFLKDNPKVNELCLVLDR